MKNKYVAIDSRIIYSNIAHKFAGILCLAREMQSTCIRKAFQRRLMKDSECQYWRTEISKGRLRVSLCPQNTLSSGRLQLWVRFVRSWSGWPARTSQS